jgi:hypothetical protein
MENEAKLKFYALFKQATEGDLDDGLFLAFFLFLHNLRLSSSLSSSLSLFLYLLSSFFPYDSFFFLLLILNHFPIFIWSSQESQARSL